MRPGPGRRSPAQLLARLRAAPPGLVDSVEVEARRDTVLAMVRVLRALNASIKDLDRSVAAHLGEHPDGAIFTSLPRSGRISAAQVLAEWATAKQPTTIPTRSPPWRHRAGHQGLRQAPHGRFRWACNKRFRAAITTFADNSRHASPWAAKVDADALARGCDYPHAVRILARAWVRVIWRCWLDGTPYDPARHNAARRLTETAASAA